MSRLVILDRDGVINRMVVDEDHGLVNSPLHPSQVQLIAGATIALARLVRLGYTLRIATNQPAAAKGLTTKANLESVHAKVLELLAAADIPIASSHICWHRAEDGCKCRKPQTGLLEEALKAQGVREGWMVGDGATDIEAGAKLGLETAFLGPRRCDMCKVYESRGVQPTHWFADLPEFVEFLSTREKA